MILLNTKKEGERILVLAELKQWSCYECSGNCHWSSKPPQYSI